MTNINNQCSPIRFQARFQKLPVTIKAQEMKEAFKVPNPWAKNEVLEGKAGDYLVKNLLNGEKYPIAPNALKEKYELVKGNIYKTRENKPVYIDADLPKNNVIKSREGEEKTNINGMPAMEAIDAAGKPYAIPGDYFLKAYAPIDAEGQAIINKLKSKIAAANK